MFLKIVSKLMPLGYPLTFHFFNSHERQNNNNDIGLFASYNNNSFSKNIYIYNNNLPND